MSQKITLHSWTMKLRRCIDSYADSLDKVRPNLGLSMRSHPLTATSISERNVILGAGSGSTATHSLQKALRLLGFTTSHYIDSHKHHQWALQILNILGGPGAPAVPMNVSTVSTCKQQARLFNYTGLSSSIDAVLDTPVAEMFFNIFLSFPQARVILTTRPSADWVKSRLAQDLDDGFVPLQEPCGSYLGSGPIMFNRTELAFLFDLNNDLVRCTVPKTQLFEIDVWKESKKQKDTMMMDLARFLGIRKFRGKHIPFPNAF